MRQKPLLRRRLADGDIDAAIAFYLNEAGADVAQDFVNRLEESIRKISRHPAIGSPRFGFAVQIPGLRTWPVKNFPYLLFYIERSSHLELLRMLHSRTDIPSWLDDID